MKKATFTAALAEGQDDPVASSKAQSQRELQRIRASGDGRVNTTLRISPEGLEALKILAAKQRTRVNDLLLEGAEHVLALHGQKMQLRK